MEIIQSIATLLLGGGLFKFIEFLIHRKDDKESKKSEVLEAIQKVDNKVSVLEEKIDQVAAKGDERDAVASRVRILRFADDMLTDRKHSKDSWDQCLSDITCYEQYCDDHPFFKNNQTEATVEFIKHNYQERLEKHDFL